MKFIDICMVVAVVVVEVVVVPGGLGLGAGAQQVYAHHHTPPLLMASLQKVEGSILCKILLEQTGVKLVIFLGKK